MKRVVIVAAVALLVVGGAALLISRMSERRFISRPDAVLSDPSRSEDYQSILGQFLKSTLGAAMREREASRAGSIFMEDFEAMFPGPDEGAALAEDGVTGRDFEGFSGPLDRAAFVARLQSLLDRYAAVEHVDLRCFDFALASDEARATAAYHWKLAGKRTNGHPIELRADLEIDFVRAGEKEWRIRRLAVPRAVRLESDLPPFADITDAAGFEFVFTGEARRLIQTSIDRRAFALTRSLAAVDWNRDGFMDLIAAYPLHRTALFINDGRGGFIPGRFPEEGAPFVLLLDVDGDGVEELITTRPAWNRGRQAALSLYVRRPGRGATAAEPEWELQPDALVFESKPGLVEINLFHIAAGDIDRDGDLDLFVSGYSNSDSYIQEFDYFDARTGQRNLLFVNQGGLRFTEESERRGIRGAQFTYVSEFFDFDGDGDQDLLVVNDYGPDVMYWNRGDGTFVEDAKHVMARGTAYGMGLAIADYDNTGRFSVHISNMYSHAGNRIVPLARSLNKDWRRNLLYAVQGNTLFERDGRGEWREVGVDRRINLGDWAWGCVFFDFDHDADKDLFVTNGFTTHSDPEAPDM